MLCLYVAYLLADVAWYSIEFYCYSSANPTGIFFSRFFAAIFAFAFGFGAVPVGLYVGSFILKGMGQCFCSGSSRTGVTTIFFATDGETDVIAVV